MAAQPELQNHKFIIPTQLLPFSDRILETEEIDKFIAVNRLIFKEEESNVNGETEVVDQENEISSESAEFIRSDKKVKNILFKVPDNYLKVSE